jgi:arylsulfatase
MIRRLLPLAAACAALLPLRAADAPLAGARPNIVFILTDDQGYGDLSCHGNPILKTPHLDRLHDEGRRFTDFHVSPTCSPTRSALFTGRHEFKNGITHTILERERLTLNATTLAQVLQSAGYTTGIFGKWHLGDEAEYQPNRRGFDEVFIHGAGGIGQTYPGSCGDAPGNKYFDPAILHNGKFVKTKGYCTDVFYGQATRWIEAQRKAGKPFFAYLPSNAPHGPYIARPEDRDLYAGKVLGDDTATFFGMIHNIDENVGKLLAKLDEWGIAKDTLVVFMNDNGGTAGTKVFNAGMRGQKGSAWIGGTRASSFWRWPGTLKPGDCSALSAHIDFFPTLAELAGAKLNDATRKQIEGRSLVPLLENPASSLPDRTLFTHVGRWPKGANPDTAKFKMCSVRNTRWHLVSATGAAEPAWELFDVQTDPGEQKDVAAGNPAVVKQLAGAFDRFWAEAVPLMVNENATGPAINPFQELYYRQFGGSPTEEDLKRMDPKRAFDPTTKAAAKKKRKQ